MKKYRRTLLRVSITLVGLLLAAAQIDFQQLWHEFLQADWRWVFAGFMLANLSMMVRAFRWQILLRGAGARAVGFWRLVELYFIGNFFNAFLPSGFGGDVIRAVEATRDISADVASGTVFLDRLTGLMVLFVFGLLGLPFRPASLPPLVTIGVFALSVAGLVGGFVVLDGRFPRWLGKLPLTNRLPRALAPEGDGPLARFLTAVASCGRSAIWGALGVSVVFNLLLVAWWTMATFAIQEPASFAYNLLVVPVFSVATLVPTIGGLGVKEMIAPLLYEGAGLSGTAAVSVSLIVFIMLRLSGLIGVPLYMAATWRDREKMV